MKNVNLNFFSVALMYVGTIMGAGFASGREIWQFFGVFGNDAYVGVVFVGILFMVMGMMTSYIARELGTNDMGRVIVPGNNKIVTNLVGYFMAFMLFTVLITMSAAGGSIFAQQFGLSKIIGGAIIIFLVIITVLGEFERVSRVFRFIMPILFGVVVLVCLLTIFTDIGSAGVDDPIAPSPMAPTWYLAAMLYISYNILAMIPIVATASINAKNKKSAILGTGFGGILLAVLAMVLVLALQRDMPFSQSLDMPMLGYSTRITTVINVIYTVVLLAAVYGSATSNYYGFTTKIKEGPKKSKIIVIVACIGFFFGLVGFKNVVAYMFPAEGFLGFIIIGMIIVNFFRVYNSKKKAKSLEDASKTPTVAADETPTEGEKMSENFNSEIYVNFPGHDRFGYPDNFERVTGGYGGEAIMVFGSEKTAIYDCGMAYAHAKLMDNIEKALANHGRDKIDIVLCSHTHYDHIGALPYILEKYPKAIVCASPKATKVFASAGARATMKRLGEAARDDFSDSTEEIKVDGFRVDRELHEGDRISIGKEYFEVLEAKGHTDCSLVYVLQPANIMFASESTGVLRNRELIHTAILKNFDDTIKSAEKCRAYGAKSIICPHYGVLPEGFSDEFFDLYIKSANEERDYIMKYYNEGLSPEEILEKHMEKYWSETRGKAQPKAAYIENAEITIRVITG